MRRILSNIFCFYDGQNAVLNVLREECCPCFSDSQNTVLNVLREEYCPCFSDGQNTVFNVVDHLHVETQLVLEVVPDVWYHGGSARNRGLGQIPIQEAPQVLGTNLTHVLEKKIPRNKHLYSRENMSLVGTNTLNERER